MGQDQLRELAIFLVARVRKNASIDWNLKESVRVRMKVMVRTYATVTNASIAFPKVPNFTLGWLMSAVP